MLPLSNSRWIYVSNHRLSDRYVHEFGLTEAKKGGFDVEIWVLSYKDIPETKVSRLEGEFIVRLVASREKLTEMANDLTEGDVLTLISAYNKQNEYTESDVRAAITQTRAKLVFLDSYLGAVFQDTFWSHLKLLVIEPRFYLRLLKELPAVLRRFFRLRIPRLVQKIAGVERIPSSIIFSIGSPGNISAKYVQRAQLVIHLPITTSGQLQSSAQSSLIPRRNFILLIDPGAYKHTDAEKLPQYKRLKLSEQDRDEQGLLIVNRVTDFLRAVSNEDLVIAAHPNGRYPKSIYRDLNVVHNQAEALLQAETLCFMVSYGSTLSSAAFTLGVPQCIVDTEFDLVQSLTCLSLSRQFRCPLWRFGSPETSWSLPKFCRSEAPLVVQTKNAPTMRLVSSADRNAIAVREMRRITTCTLPAASSLQT